MFTILGIIWVSVSAIIFMLYYWKIEFRISKHIITDSSTKFLNSVINDLGTNQKRFREKFWLYGISIIIGINIYYIDAINDFDLLKRLLTHIGMSALLLVSISYAIKNRERKFKKQYQPLIDELLEIKKDLE
jgi:hypothetical protein